jgi:2-polyprenyl-6-hydroxyphenyl methylase/3-demethylubiquinone-9 3-methyltransferase
VSWGSEAHVRRLFGDRVDRLEATRGEYVERSADPAAYRELFKRCFGPVIALYADAAGDPARLAALDADLLDFATRANRGRPGGPAAYPYEYLLVLARRAVTP